MAKPRAKGAAKTATPKTATTKTAAAKAVSPKSRPLKTTPSKLGASKLGSAKLGPSKLVSAKRPADRLERLWLAVQQVREGRRDSPRTARLIAAGPPKLAQKVVEEAGEVAIEAVLNQSEALINESVDLLYNLVALWNGSGIEVSAIWAEMDRREATLGMAEKLPKTDEV